MESFAGKVAVVTGAASGIGLATAKAFAGEGMKVVLADIEAGPLEAARDELASGGHDVLAVPTDVSSWDSVESLAARSVEHFGGVHVVHNNAGVVSGGPVDQVSLEDWEWVLGVNLWGVIYGVRAFAPRIKASGGGHVVNTASTAGLHAPAFIGPYGVSKFGVVALSETLQREAIAQGDPLRVSVLCPGMTATRIVEAARNRPEAVTAAHRSSPQEEGFLQGAGSVIASAKRPDEVAALVVDAVRTERFWILTHPDWLPILEERAKAIGEDGRLVDGFGG